MVFVPIVYFFYPETANLTLVEIDFLFTERTRHPSLMSRAGEMIMIGDGWGEDGGDGRSVRPDES
ncbi:uncharacterized protein N7477_000439 [Penicillium maclennaniae]|uniref:uncharacterized protein n=1 Tax=Penicillium maclennaniae TaxID=1343394 RepID=UPI002541B8F9|nr:uncharacterized protein N7477_000439 [Penicillium maclennaniae]KAJ5684094.1 hypothetical protein N7477_000439 [Penicillium maclennaniae]